MNTPLICSSCRRKLTGKLWPVLPTLPRREAVTIRRFISLAKEREHGKDIKNDPRNELLHILDENAPTTRKSPRPARRSTPRRPLNPTKDTGDLLELFFEEGNKSLEGKASHETHTGVEKVDNMYTHIEALKAQLNHRNNDLGSIWEYFKTHLGPRVWAANGINPDAKSFKIVASQLLKDILKNRRKSSTSVNITEVVKTYLVMGMLPIESWHKLEKILLEDLSSAWDQFQQQHGKEGSSQLGLKLSTQDQMSLEDLLRCWRAFLVCNTRGVRLSTVLNENSQSDWSFFNNSHRSRQQAGRAIDFETAFWRSLTPTHQARASAQHKSLAFDAFRLYVLMLGSNQRFDGYLAKDHPFAKIMSSVLVSSSTTSADLNQRWPADINTNVINWNTVLQAAKSITDSNNQPILVVDTPATETTSRRLLGLGSMSIHNGIKKALASNDVSELDRMWALVQKPITQAGNQRSSRTEALSYGLYHHFITAFMAVKDSGRAIHVWNSMIHASVIPIHSSWNAMLEGCKMSRDAEAIESVWKRLLASDIGPDMICWNTRLSGLLECKKSAYAIRALEHMGKLWLRAAEKKYPGQNPAELEDIGTVIKPTIAIVNAMVVGLLRLNNTAAAKGVLAWGLSFGIQPDTITFNTLLRPLAREGRIDDIKIVLEHMQKQGLQADVATFTTILDEILMSVDSMTVNEQLEIVNAVFGEMAAAGVKANQVTYGRILHSLLQSKSDDLTAVQYVMKKMAEEGFHPNSHIYTTMLGRYFSQTPPDLEGIRSIIARVRSSNISVDNIFWDRIIEGYSKIGDTGSALSILGRSPSSGATAGWWALTLLLQALSSNGEWDLARQVVKNVRADKGEPLPAHTKGVEGQHAFWATVNELGPRVYED